MTTENQNAYGSFFNILVPEAEHEQEQKFCTLLYLNGRRKMLAYVDDLWSFDPPQQRKEETYTTMVDLLHILADELGME